MKANPPNGVPSSRQQSAGWCWRITRRLLGVLAVGWLGAFGTLRGAEMDYYRHPPGCVWGTLIETNLRATSIAAIPDGYVVSGTVSTREPDPGIDMWGFVAKLDHQTGTVLLSADFHDDPDSTLAEAIVPLRNSGGGVDGFALVGGKQHFLTDPNDPRAEQNVPLLWLARLNTSLVRQWETIHGGFGHDIIGQAVVTDAAGWVIGAVDHYLPAGSVGWLGRFDETGGLAGEPLTPIGCEGVYAVEPALDGGYVVGTDCGLLKVSPSLAVEWRADPRVGASQVWNRYKAVRRARDGSFVGVGSRLRHQAAPAFAYEGMVLTKVTAGGEIVWQRFDTNVIGNDLLVLADGSVLVAGEHPAGRNGGVDAWLLQTGPDGATQWQMFLGEEADERARALTAAAEGGGYALLGEATVSDVTQMWVARLRSGLEAPVPAFTVSPHDPIFVDQEVTFDASASSAPGSSIATWEWDFGDGTDGTGAVVQHRFHDRGVYHMTLTVVNRDGLCVSISQDVVVTGLQVQWERWFGGDYVDSAVSIVEARDGGFVISGSQFKRSWNRGGVWVFKTDRRGRLIWDRMIDNPAERKDDEVGRCIIRAHDTGYVVAGDCEQFFDPPFAWFNQAFLLSNR